MPLLLTNAELAAWAGVAVTPLVTGAVTAFGARRGVRLELEKHRGELAHRRRVEWHEGAVADLAVLVEDALAYRDLLAGGAVSADEV